MVPKTTVLGVGVVSKNTVDAAIYVAGLVIEPIFLICSRRQIDRERVGGGYVNDWSTEAFADYLQDRRPKNLVIARDHGGPYQGKQILFDRISDAMDDAANSFRADIIAGFEFLHFDTCMDGLEFASDNNALARYVDLLMETKAFAKAEGRDFDHEVGTEDQVHAVANIDATFESLQRLIEASRSRNLPLPEYLVVQTGTKVVATENVGTTAKITTLLSEQAGMLSSLSEMVNNFGMKIKCHNGDYIQHATLRMLNYTGVGGLNVAPEFGTSESKTLLSLLEHYKMHDERDEFVRVAVESKKWCKWVSSTTTYSNLQLATICGHYCFTHDSVKRVKSILNKEIKKSGLKTELDDILRLEIARNILFYVNALGYTFKNFSRWVA